MNSQAAAIYLRVSTNQQTTDNQEPDCLRLADSRGWDVVEIYREYESAAKRRPVFDRVMADARRGRFRFLIVWRLDRFGRRMQGNINDVLELDGVGVDVMSVREPWLASGGSARNLLLAIFSWLAEEERRVLVERVKAGMERARREGKQCGRPPVPPQKIAAAAARVRAGLPLRTAAREQGIGWVPVRKFLACAAAERVRAGVSVRTASREYCIGVDTVRRVLAGTSYLNRYPLRTRATAVPDPGTAYLSFARARDIARKLGLCTKSEWINWCGGDGYTVDIPMRPHEFYRGEWKGWSDWLGCRQRLAFSEARTFARGLGFRRMSGADGVGTGNAPGPPPMTPGKRTQRSSAAGPTGWVTRRRIAAAYAQSVLDARPSVRLRRAAPGVTAVEAADVAQGCDGSPRRGRSARRDGRTASPCRSRGRFGPRDAARRLPSMCPITKTKAGTSAFGQRVIDNSAGDAVQVREIIADSPWPPARGMLAFRADLRNEWWRSVLVGDALP